MKTATVRDLRNNFSKLEAWLAEGESIEIQKRGEPVAMLTKPQSNGKDAPRTKLDFTEHRARVKKIWGDRFFSPEEVAELREFTLNDPDDPYPA